MRALFKMLLPSRNAKTLSRLEASQPLQGCPLCGEIHHFGEDCEALRGRRIHAWGGQEAWFERMKDDTMAYFVGNDPDRGGFMCEVPLTNLAEASQEAGVQVRND